MQRKFTVLWKTVAVFLVAASLLFGFSWNYPNSKPYIPKWFYSSDWNAADETGTETVTSPMEDAPLSAPPSPPSKPVLKDGNATLLEMTPSYIKAIMTPEDTSFPRLACPAPTGDRYLYLKASSTNMTYGLTIRPKYFFALDLHQCASLLPRLIGSVVESIRFLGPQNCALSVIEGRSDDGTFEILFSLRREIERIGAKYYFNSSDINPTVGDRIKALAELRNQALQPLLGHADKVIPTNTTTVIFLNDVALCMEDILELIHQRKYQNADMTCAMDWTYVGPEPTFYDVWIARGMNGDTFFNIPEDGNWDSAWNIFWNNPSANEHQRTGKPFQVFSCWNGATAFTAAPFLESKIRFRASYEHECPQGEPKTWCTEMWHLGYGKIAVIPSVNLEYSDEAAKKIKAVKGYVSRWSVGGANDGEERINWETTPPSTVKCMPSYQNQTWLPEEQLVEHESVP
ncbi:MAG: hypothetical protein Q9175_002022 [Cornicularia normoerica]